MKILVTAKQVIDYVKVRIKVGPSGIELPNVKMSMNPFDEIALEEALRLREKNLASEVVAVSIGKDTVQETLRHALALGADRALFIRSEHQHSSLNIAKILHKIALEEKPNLILMGKQAVDSDNNQTPQMLAALLHWPQATFASQILCENNRLQVTREIDSGLETLSVELPAVVSVDLRLNEPRYASLPNIMKAKQKPLTTIELNTLNLSLRESIEVVSVKTPSNRSAGVIVDSVAALITKLQAEAKVLS